MSDRKVPRLTLATRQRLVRSEALDRRRTMAEAKRALARLSFEERVLEAQAKVTSLEDAAAIGRLWTEIDLKGWKRVLKVIKQDAPTEALERLADLARRQLARLLAEDGPAALERADDTARVIEGQPAPSGEPAPNEETEPAHGAHGAGNGKPSAPERNGRWG